MTTYSLKCRGAVITIRAVAAAAAILMGAGNVGVIWRFFTVGHVCR